MLQGGGGYPAARAGEMLNLVAAYAADPLDPQWLMDTLGPDRGGAHHLPPALRRPAAAAGAGVRGGRPPRAGVPRRADRGHGRARPNRGVGVDRRAAPRRRDGRADHPPAQRGRGAGRPAGDHRPRRRGGHRHAGRADAQRRREPAAVQRAAGCSTCRCWSSALPEGYKATEAAPGEYLVEGHIDPQVLATVTAWCARLDVLATDMRVEQRSLEDVFLDLTGRELRS